MKKVRVTITQELEVPDYCELVQGPGGLLLKLNQHYLSPGIEYVQSKTLSQREMKFSELDAATMDTIFGGIVRETKDICEI